MPTSSHGLNTLTLDVGGTGLKASVLDSAGSMLHDRVRIETAYPCPPEALVKALTALTSSLPAFDRISVGFPGVVRDGVVRTAPHLVTSHGPGTAIDAKLVSAWSMFDLSAAIRDALAKPTRIINDADLQGLDVTTGQGLEVVVTLGTGFGTAILRNGILGPHLELSQHVFRRGKSYDEQLGDIERKRIGNASWNRRVRKAMHALDTLLDYDRILVGGGNARRLKGVLPAKASLIDPNAGILGGLKLWDQPASDFGPAGHFPGQVPGHIAAPEPTGAQPMKTRSTRQPRTR